MNRDDRIPRRWLLLTLVVLSLAGCNRRLSFERTLSMGPGDVSSFVVDAPRGEQKVVVTFTCDNSPVDVYLALEPDLEAASKAIRDFKAPTAILAKQMKAKEGSLEATIPAKKAFGLIVASPIRDSTVQIKIAGK